MLGSGFRNPSPQTLVEQSNSAEPLALIADDQPDVLAALRLLLKSEGYQTEAVTSPAAALDAIRRLDFDLVLMDLNYARDTTSGEEGLDLLARIRDIDQTLPVVVMTAWGSIELAVEAIRGGSGDFIQKPWDNSHLLSVVRKQLELGRDLRCKQRMAAAREQAREREMVEARAIQQRLLPRDIPQLNGCEISALWQPALEVSGDYFDILKFSEHSAALCIADVMGKGMPAALLMSNIQAAVKSFATAGMQPDRLCVQVNRLICGNVDPGKFITFFYGIVQTKEQRLIYANAGHNAPILIGRDGQTTQLTKGGPLLGISSAFKYRLGIVDLTPGDRLVLFTDGIPEARNSEGEEFGEDRLLELIKSCKGLRASALQEEIMAGVANFSGGVFQDDATLVILTLR
jgi:sigma-B regulation protein RsbU (phosphoserine phosphatase)